MIRREGRLANPESETAPRVHSPRRGTTVNVTWERSIFVGAVIAILMLGAIGGMNVVIGIFK